MRTALLFATFALLATAAIAEGNLARADDPPAGQAAPAPVTPETPAATPEKPAATPEKPAEESQPAPDIGVITSVAVQGNRRVEADAIRAQIPIKPGDNYDRE